ncbi:FHA domain-containing protein [Paenibacillus albidus]|nr:FHA domain-containing protein [Paenibacillus albidus]
MLMNSGIPHHLRLQLKEIDLQVTLEYALSGTKMLSHLLRSEQLTMTAFFGLLLQIARGMEEGRLYMLRAEQYALHEDYIFIEGPLQSGKVYLAYIPIEQQKAAATPGENIKSLIMVLMASITELAGDGVQRLLQYCGEEGFTPGGLKDLLAALLTERDAGDSRPETQAMRVGPMASTETQSAAVRPLAVEGGRQPGQAGLWERQGAFPRSRLLPDTESEAADKRNPAARISGYPSIHSKEEDHPSDSSSMGEDNESSVQPSRYRTYLVLACLLTDALLWKFLYLNSPELIWLVVCGAVTIILAAGSWMFWTGRIKLGKDDEAEELDSEADQMIRKMSRKELEWNFDRYPVTPTAQAAQAGSEVGGKIGQESMGLADSRLQTIPEENKEWDNPYKPAAPVAVAATTLLSRSAGTERAPAGEASRHSVPFLERRDGEVGENPEKIELNRSSFIIGRSAEVAQYVEQSEGTSRVHAEISRSPGGYVLKDLDSRNGTFFQGEAMIPYKEYPLTDGTEFTIIKGSYTFRTA